jgi:hypothetical protein
MKSAKDDPYLIKSARGSAFSGKIIVGFAGE